MKRIVVFVLVLVAHAEASAQSAENVAVVINTGSPASLRIGDYYAQARKIPATNIIRINTTTKDEIASADYTRTIETPIAQGLRRAGLQDRILYVVLTKGVPLRIKGTAGRNGTAASVDSELTLLYRRMAGAPASLAGPVANPYFLGRRPLEAAQPFTHRQHDIFLVARLDGFNVEDAIALIDRAQAGAQPALKQRGRIVLDQRSGADAVGDSWLAEAATRLRALGQGDRVMLEDSGRPVRDVDDVLGYYAWGSNDPQNRVRRLGMRFVPGAIAASFVSTDARTFEAPPDEWKPTGDITDKKSWFAGSAQSLAGDLIREGVTGIAANVSEPYLDGAVRPEILFPAYLAGFNMVEAYYLALPHLGWQTVVIGDPLGAPFRTTVLTRAEIEDAPDPATELPGIFSKWRMDVARAVMTGIPPTVVSLIVRSDARNARGDTKGARQALEEATAIAPESAPAHLQLALMHETAGEHAHAIERYRRVVNLQRDNVVALNNLAYSLAVRQSAPSEALPFARRAVTLAPNNPTIVDTLAWIQHLLGNQSEAANLLRPVVQKTTGNPEIHLHAAIVLAAIGEKSAADAQLTMALGLDPMLGEREDVRILQKQLAAKNP